MGVQKKIWWWSSVGVEVEMGSQQLLTFQYCLDGAIDDHLIYIYTGVYLGWDHNGRRSRNFSSRNVPCGN